MFPSADFSVDPEWDISILSREDLSRVCIEGSDFSYHVSEVPGGFFSDFLTTFAKIIEIIFLCKKLVL